MLNPYAAPGIPEEPAGGELNRRHRAILAEFIRQRLDNPEPSDESTAVFEQLAVTRDPVVLFVVAELGRLYDDDADVMWIEDKAEWDYVQRLLLLLDSTSSIRVEREWIWSWTQPFAALAFVGYIALALRLGWGHRLWIGAIPFGGVSLVIAWLRRKTAKAAQRAYDPILAPFATFGDLRRAWDRSTRFRKRQAPESLRHPESHKRLVGMLFQGSLSVNAVLLWLALGPYVLAFQALPTRRSQIRVIEGAPQDS